MRSRHEISPSQGLAARCSHARQRREHKTPVMQAAQDDGARLPPRGTPRNPLPNAGMPGG
eukprot:6452458-Prymnesium_polylepis.1